MSGDTPDAGVEGATHSAASGDVFISYASQDQAIADAVCAALETHGVKCWIAPRDVSPGQFYADAIVRALNHAAVLVLVLTEHAVTSPHVLREVERTSAKRHAIVSIRLAAVTLPPALEYFLSASHWLDASASSIDAATPALVEAVRRLLASPLDDQRDRAGATSTPPVAPVADRHGSRPSPRLSRPVVVLSAAIVVGLAYVALDKLWLAKDTASTRPPATFAPTPAAAVAAVAEKSIAVLPFVDMSADHDQEYFSDGLAEELIDRLTKVPDLRVPARTSSSFFKGKQTTIAEIGKALNVAHVLEGSVRKSGRTLRITVQLVRADNGYHLWSQTYDRRLDDIFKVQDEISAAVVKTLKASLLEPAATRGSGPRSADAYLLFLQARLFANRGSSSDTLKAIDYLRKSLQLDPNSAIAWSLLSRSYTTINGTAALDWRTGRDLALQAAEKALTLDPKLPEAHIAMGKLRFYDFEFGAAATEMARARELDPTNADAMLHAANVAKAYGQLDDALRLVQAALARDPMNPNFYDELEGVYMAMGRFAEAEAAARVELNINPAAEFTRSLIGLAILLRGDDPATAIAEIAREPEPDRRAACLAIASWISGRKAEAEQAFAGYERKHAADDAYGIAVNYALRGNLDAALAWLERAYRQHEWGLTEIIVDPFFKNLRPDPRYRAFLRKLKLPE